MELGLDGRVALVMGGSSGIGLGIARSLAREGGRVALTSRSQERADAAAAGLGAEAVGLAADSADRDAIEALPARVADALGPIDILVANTGGPPAGGALEGSDEGWARAHETLFEATRLLVRACVPGMRERGWGRIVSVGSSSTIEPIEGLAMSNSIRMATVGLLATLAREVAADGITVNIVATGRIDTQRLAELAGSRERVEERARAEIPAGRLGTPEEYGDLVAFLASERAAYLTGTVIPLDGGLSRSV